MMMTVRFFAAAGFCLATGLAMAQDGQGECFGLSFDVEQPVKLGRILPKSPKTYFYKGSNDNPDCPQEAAKCQAKAYLQPGDLVTVNRVANGMLCGQYVGAKGRTTIGWLPAAAIAELAPLKAPKPDDWMGDWARDEATLKIRTKRGLITVTGEAVANSHDPQAVKNGNVRTGNIDATVEPAQATRDGALQFGDGEKVAFDPTGTGNCQMRLWRVEDKLLVEDTGQCGGLGVSFTGIYARAK